MVFRNDRASKMHDKLPMLLFQMNNYIEIRKNYSIFIYHTPYNLYYCQKMRNLKQDYYI